VFVVVVVLACAVFLSGCFNPVVESQAIYSISDFEGLRVASYIPGSPVGIIYVFHGRRNSVDFGWEVETIDTLNEFTARGYGFVISESVERGGEMRWNTSNGSLSGNPDLARMERLHQSVRDSTGVDSGTPIFTLGHSNGSRFATLFGQTMADAGYPVRAVGAYMGETADPVRANYSVPTFFATADNDPLTPSTAVVQSYFDQVTKGASADLRIGVEQTLSPLRFMRIAGVDGNLAQEIYNYLVIQFIWYPDGNRLMDTPGQAIGAVESAVLPPAAEPFRAEIVRQAQVVLAGHPFRADFKVDLANWFDAHR
jgi:hypothetical protein